jgi:hypothetical protein
MRAGTSADATDEGAAGGVFGEEFLWAGLFRR